MSIETKTERPNFHKLTKALFNLSIAATACDHYSKAFEVLKEAAALMMLVSDEADGVEDREFRVRFEALLRAIDSFRIAHRPTGAVSRYISALEVCAYEVNEDLFGL